MGMSRLIKFMCIITKDFADDVVEMALGWGLGLGRSTRSDRTVNLT